MNDEIETPEMEEYTPEEVTDTTLLDKLDESSQVYPIWNPKTPGEIVRGFVEHVEFMQHLNDGKGAYIVRFKDKKQNKFVTFPNVVMQKKMLQLTANNEMSELVGKILIIRYEKEVQPQDTRKKAYKTFTVIEE